MAFTLSCDDSRQVVHTHVTLSPSSVIWYWTKGGGDADLHDLLNCC